MHLQNTKQLRRRLGIALLLTAAATQVHAGDYEYSGSATTCTGTCDSFAALGGPGGAINATPSSLDGVVTINGSPGASFGFADVDPNTDFEVFNTAEATVAAIFAPNPATPDLVNCAGMGGNPLPEGQLCNPTTANPLPLNSDIATLRDAAATQGTATGGTLDVNGDIVTGTILLEFIIPPFNNNGAWAILDLATGTTQVCLFYPSAGCVPNATEAVVFAGAWSQQLADFDGDGVADAIDNCTNVANPGQQDTDGDGHGNICDADFNNTCGPVNFLDLAIMQGSFFTINPLLDLNSSGGPVNFGDLGIMQGLFFALPGPSAPGALCN